MVRLVLVTAAYVCCGLVLASFLLFALDEASGASQHQVAEISTPSPGSRPSLPAKKTQPRKFIDGAAATLTSPFSPLVGSSSEWGKKIFETICALLLYGFGLGFLARLTAEKL